MSTIKTDKIIPVGSALTVAGALSVEGAVTMASILTVAGGVSAASLTSKIQPITASSNGTALTITLNPTILDFRSNTQGSGAVTSVVVPTTSITIPSGVKLGTVSGVQSRIMVLAIKTETGVELAVTNIAGGVNLNECGVINTEALSVGCVFTGAIALVTRRTVYTGSGALANDASYYGATAGFLTLTSLTSGALTIGQALSGTNIPSGTVVKGLSSGTLNTNGSSYRTNAAAAATSTTITGGAGWGIYSTIERASVPYRVVGYIESTQETAGTWATAPSTIQGMGGEVVNAMSSIGYGQTWQNVVASRAVSTTYYNTTGKPIQVAYAALADSNFFVNGEVVSSIKSGASIPSFAIIVPPGNSYKITDSVTYGGDTGRGQWSELR